MPGEGATEHICPYAAALSDDEDASHHSRSPKNNEALLQVARTKCPAFSKTSGGGCPFRDVVVSNPENIMEVMKTVPPSHFIGSSNVLSKVVLDQKQQNNNSGGNNNNDAETTTATTTAATQFQLAMEHVHQVSSMLEKQQQQKQQQGNDNNDENSTTTTSPTTGKSKNSSSRDSFIIRGGCPFKAYHRDHSHLNNHNNNTNGGNNNNDSSSKRLARAMEDFSLAAIMGRMASLNEDENEENEEGRGDKKSFKEEEVTKTDANTTKNKEPEQQQLENIEIPPTQPQKRRRSSNTTNLLSQALKTGTAQSHTAAENVHFVHDFIQGKIHETLYKEMICGLYHVYTTLEALLEVYAPTYFPTLYFPKELNRKECLEDDMEYWFGYNWQSKKYKECMIPTPAVQDYIDRMEQVAKHDPLLLLSHAYTRYLGDLSGGKVLSRIARRALKLERNDDNGGRCCDGLRFYEFEYVKSAKVFKDRYRVALDELTFTLNDNDNDNNNVDDDGNSSSSEEEEEEKIIAKLVAEANVAFALNMRVFEELDVKGEVPGARVRNVEEALAYYDIEQKKQQQQPKQGEVTTAGEEEEEEEAKCPFGFVGGPNPHKKQEESTVSTTAETATLAQSLPPSETAVSKKHSGGGRCPWPFVFFHDPMMGMKDWQTWFVIGLVLCWCWSRIV